MKCPSPSTRFSPYATLVKLFPVFVLLCHPNSVVFGGDDWLIESELMKGWIRGSNAPPLVTTSAVSVPKNEAGVLTNSTTSTIFGGGLIDTEDRTGARFKLQKHLYSESDIGVFFGGMYLANGSNPQIFESDGVGIPVLGRPFYNTNTQAQDAELVSFPDVLIGQVAVTTASELYIGDLGIAKAWLRDSSLDLDLNFGYRFLSFRDGLNIREDLISIDQGGVIPVGTTFDVNDSFATLNQFHGGSIGSTLKAKFQEWDFGVYGGGAMGALNRKLNTVGSTHVTIPGLDTDSYHGGLLALPSNMGSYHSTRFVAIPEIKLLANRRLARGLSINFGYTVLVVPQTWRAAEKIDYSINETQVGGGMLVGLVRPAFQENSSSMWIQSLSLGLGYSW